jgi:hypothetical protein
MDDAKMIRPGLQFLAISILITVVSVVHLGARAIVAQNIWLGIASLAIVLASLKPLSRYLD